MTVPESSGLITRARGVLSVDEGAASSPPPPQDTMPMQTKARTERNARARNDRKLADGSMSPPLCAESLRTLVRSPGVT
jgi:hypothetical protein